MKILVYASILLMTSAPLLAIAAHSRTEDAKQRGDARAKDFWNRVSVGSFILPGVCLIALLIIRQLD